MAYILVIDDDKNVRAFICSVLEADGHSVREARDGVEGMWAFVERRPDLVVCDVFMPRRDGLNVVRDIRDRSADVPIVLISGGSGHGDLLPIDFQNVAQTIGATRGLTKPFTVQELQAIVREVLQGPPR
ncbi:MAG: response regulator transcription factor [Gemmataceae bacterium]